MKSKVCEDLCERWANDYIANKNILAFDECDFDCDDYSDLVKRSYYCLKEIFDSYKLSNADLHNSNPNFLFDYAELVSSIRSYSTTENFQDYSEEYVASMLIAKKLAENAVYPNSILDSVLLFSGDYEEEDSIKYDIEAGNFLDITEHAFELYDYLLGQSFDGTTAYCLFKNAVKKLASIIFEEMVYITRETQGERGKV